LGYTLQELADAVGGILHGQADTPIDAVATIRNARAGSISFLANRSYYKYLLDTRATAILLSEQDLENCPVAAIVVKNPYLAYAKISAMLNPTPSVAAGIHPSAVVAEDAAIHASVAVAANAVIESGATIAPGCSIGPGCVVGRNVSIDKNTKLVASVTLCHDVKIGCNVILHPGVVIGADGFGIANDQGVWIKVPQLGSVNVGDDVEIGANTTVDRGALEDTVIEQGVKLDNQIQVAHNVIIGAHTAIAGCTGIAGSTHIGKHCAIGGAVSIVGHLEIVDNVQITAASTVTQSIKEPGLYSSGTPLQENRLWHRNFVRFRQLEEMAKRIRKLEKQIENKSAG
jgi:UDP-3-O-[3-hydroxymyristoyl] glucosamine N-acyltransferase